jgi:membrane-associated protease RseP (regulator of RpoE activity)
MKTRITFTLLILAALTSSLLAEPRRQTIVIRDGKVIEGKGLAELDGLLAGKRAFLGVSLTDISPELREHFGAPKDSGVLVGNIEDGSPAEKAGVRVGDIIVAVDGKDVESSWDLRKALQGKKDGDTARIEVVRGRGRQSLVATVIERDFPGSLIRVGDLGDLGARLGETFSGPEWRARVERLQNCDELQDKLRTLETRLKELERKLQK